MIKKKKKEDIALYLQIFIHTNNSFADENKSIPLNCLFE